MTLRAAPLAATLLTLLATPALTGCAAEKRAPDVETISINESERIAAARDLARQAAAAEDPDDAARLLRRAVTIWSDFPAAWNNLGVIHLEQRRYMDAAESFRTASERAATDPRPLYNLGLTWERTRHLREAEQLYRRALERDPRYLPALRGVTHAQERLGEMDEHTLERLRVALMVERDPEWRAYFERRKIAAEAEQQAP